MAKGEQLNVGNKENGSGLICRRKEFIALRRNTENSVKHYPGFPKMKILLEKKCKVTILMTFPYFFLSLRAKENVFWILSKYPGGKYKFWQ